MLDSLGWWVVVSSMDKLATGCRTKEVARMPRVASELAFERIQTLKVICTRTISFGINCCFECCIGPHPILQNRAIIRESLGKSKIHLFVSELALLFADDVVVSVV